MTDPGCCGGHAHAEGHQHEHATGGLCASDAACASDAGSCGMEGEACCGGHGADLFAFPTTTEVVAMPAVILAGMLDLVEKLAEDPRVLIHEPDYVEGQRLLGEQAPELVGLREQFLERMRTLMAAAQG